MLGVEEFAKLRSLPAGEEGRGRGWKPRTLHPLQKVGLPPPPKISVINSKICTLIHFDRSQRGFTLHYLEERIRWGRHPTYSVSPILTTRDKSAREVEHFRRLSFLCVEKSNTDETRATKNDYTDGLTRRLYSYVLW